MVIMAISAMAVNAQTLTLESNKNDISASEAGNYDRVEYVRQVEANTTVLVSFPAKLDGYYFGPDAERFLVKEVKEGANGKLNITTEKMADNLDFVPGQTYLVSPTQNIECIVSLTPAKKTPVSQTTESLIYKVVDNPATAIADITVVSKGNDAIYDVSGRRYSSTSKPGIYVIKNRKVLIK